VDLRRLAPYQHVREEAHLRLHLDLPLARQRDVPAGGSIHHLQSAAYDPAQNVAKPQAALFRISRQLGKFGQRVLFQREDELGGRRSRDIWCYVKERLECDL